VDQIEETTGVAPSTGAVAARLGGGLIRAADADVGADREGARFRRLRILALVLGLPMAYLWYRIVDGRPFNVFALPSLPGDPVLWVIPIVFVLAIGIMVAMPLLSGRSPHVLYRPEQIDVRLEDVKGLDGIVDEVVKTLNTFLAYGLYRDKLGGRPRRGLLFEGAPGTGKTHLAKAMAREAGVPFLFASATNFQSMWYGATARKIRSYFKVLRRTARREGGAIGFIEEIDAIGTVRSGMRSTPRDVAAFAAATGLRLDAMMSEGTGGVVNELLVQMQSFDDPPPGDRIVNRFVDGLNAFLPSHRQLERRPPRYSNILLIAATNRAGDLDPALLRPGRFDRTLTFERPAKTARRELIDHFLARKSHGADLDRDDLRDQLAGQTFGYTPVMIEHLFDESLVLALREGRDALGWKDIQTARLTMEVGQKNPVPYAAHERNVIATHEAGHATMAYLAGTRRLEVLSIVKRSGSLGLLAHGDLDEVYTRSRTEMVDLIRIAFGGMCSEELWFGESTTGPSGDLAAATKLAAELVGACGMSGSLVSLAAIEEGAFSSRNLIGRVLGDPVTRPEVDRVLAEAKAYCRAYLDANRPLVEALRDALLDRDELVGEEITEVLEAAGPAIREGLVIERRRGQDRRTRDLLNSN
jgi:cell division protease FtsH